MRIIIQTIDNNIEVVKEFTSNNRAEICQFITELSLAIDELKDIYEELK